MKILAKNRTAFKDYEIVDRMEAGIVLLGSEVKSAKLGQLNLKESYIKITRNNQAYLVGAHISPYKKGEKFNPIRDKKLLLNKKEIIKLSVKLRESNLTIIPLKAYLKNNLVKIEIGLARRKKQQDKRKQLIKKAQERDIKRELKN
jgi:SsrA-binding protein